MKRGERKFERELNRMPNSRAGLVPFSKNRDSRDDNIYDIRRSSKSGTPIGSDRDAPRPSPNWHQSSTYKQNNEGSKRMTISLVGAANRSASRK